MNFVHSLCRVHVPELARVSRVFNDSPFPLETSSPSISRPFCDSFVTMGRSHEPPPLNAGVCKPRDIIIEIKLAAGCEVSLMHNARH
jgi:hypothetical protein